MTRSTCRSRVSTEYGNSPSIPYLRRSSSVKAVPLLRTGSFSSSWCGKLSSTGCSSLVGGVTRCARERQDRQGAHALCAVDQHTFDVSRRGGASVETGIVIVAELGPAVRVVKVHDDVGGIEQHDQVLREITDCVDV